jgi:hypothetical protein
MRLRPLVLALLVLIPVQVSAEWHVKPFLGVTFGGGTTLSDFEQAVGEPNVVFGGTVTRIGEMIGFEGDFGWAPGFFESDDPPPLATDVARSSVITLTGNVVIALPRRLAEYTLRPYIAGGFGLMRVRIDDAAGLLPLSTNLPTINIGGGATGFLTERIGLSWDLRYFRNVGGKVPPPAATFFAPRLSFWRANMALTWRY